VVRRGEIYWANLNPVKGREQAGRRPVLIVSSNSINRQPLIVTVVVGTDGLHISRDYPTNVRVSAKQSGLPKDTIFLCFQIRSLDPARLEGEKGEPIGKLSPALMSQVDQSIRLTLEL
jgi:mRNA interferase MazF